MEELYELLGDLSDLGMKSCLLKGKDFGYGPGMDGKNNGKLLMYLTDEAVGWLLEQGHIQGDSHVYRRGAEGMGKRWNLSLKDSFCDTWQDVYKMSYVLVPTYPKGYYKVMGTCGDSGFGSRSFQYELLPRSVKNLLGNLEARLLALTLGDRGMQP